VKSGAAFDNFRALIVEDNGHMRMLLRELLNGVGIREVSEAANGQAALAVLQKRQCDLILSDMAMAPMDGIAFTRHIRTDEASPNHFVPIIMVTGHTEIERVKEARDAGVTEFLAKPVTPHNLYARIAEIVERPRAFVRTETYFGPDRRRKILKNYGGPWRRHDDYDVGEKQE
jgi:two-component system chemotaxis response regulator CheY